MRAKIDDAASPACTHPRSSCPRISPPLPSSLALLTVQNVLSVIEIVKCKMHYRCKLYQK
jgi:hypothetical protein